MSPTYLVEVACRGCACRVELNGVHIYDSRYDGATSSSNANPYVLDGLNQVEVYLAALPTVSSEETPRCRVTFDVSRGGGPDATETLSWFQWRSPEWPLDEDVRKVFTQRIELAKTFGPWAWQTARPYAAADRHALELALGALHAALASRDVDAAMHSLRVKHSELGRALGVSGDEHPAVMQRRLFAGLFAEDWSMFPLELGELDLRVQAGGRLVEVTDVRGDPPVVGLAGQLVWGLVPRMSCIGGEWCVVR